MSGAVPSGAVAAGISMPGAVGTGAGFATANIAKPTSSKIYLHLTSMQNTNILKLLKELLLQL